MLTFAAEHGITADIELLPFRPRRGGAHALDFRVRVRKAWTSQADPPAPAGRGGSHRGLIRGHHPAAVEDNVRPADDLKEFGRALTPRAPIAPRR